MPVRGRGIRVPARPTEPVCFWYDRSEYADAQGLFADDALPLYERTAARLLDDLRAAAARPGDRLPSERAMVTRYAVSRVTLRAALAQLEARGVVRPSSSRGWFVAEPGLFPETVTAPASTVPRSRDSPTTPRPTV